MRSAHAVTLGVAMTLSACELLVGANDFRLRTDAPDASSGDAGGDDGQSPGDGAVSSDGTVGPAGPAFVLAENQARPTRIALDSTTVFWRNAGEAFDGGLAGQRIMRMDRTGGGAPAVVYEVKGGDGLAIDADHVYFGNETACVGSAQVAVMRVTKTGLSPVGYAKGSDGCQYFGARELVTSASIVYFATGGLLARSPIVGGAPATLASGETRGLAFDGASVYFGRPATKSIARIDIADVTDAEQEFATLQTANAIGTDAAAVYWVTDNATVMRLDRDKPRTAPTVLAKDEKGPIAIAVNGTHVYWVNGGDGSIRRIPKAGGEPETVASGQEDPRAIVADDRDVFWVSARNGKVMGANLR